MFFCPEIRHALMLSERILMILPLQLTIANFALALERIVENKSRFVPPVLAVHQWPLRQKNLSTQAHSILSASERAEARGDLIFLLAPLLFTLHQFVVK